MDKWVLSTVFSYPRTNGLQTECTLYTEDEWLCLWTGPKIKINTWQGTTLRFPFALKEWQHIVKKIRWRITSISRLTVVHMNTFQRSLHFHNDVEDVKVYKWIQICFTEHYFLLSYWSFIQKVSLEDSNLPCCLQAHKLLERATKIGLSLSMATVLSSSSLARSTLPWYRCGGMI